MLGRKEFTVRLRPLMHPAKRARTAQWPTQLDSPTLNRVADQLAELTGANAGPAAKLLQRAASSGSLTGPAAEQLLDVAWKELHTGHWAQVDSSWRAAYMAASFFAARARWQREAADCAIGCLRVVDLGLMLGDHTFRRSLLDAADFLEGHIREPSPLASCSATTSLAGTAPAPARAASAVPLRLLSGSLPPPPRLRLPSLAFFFNEHMVPARPAVLLGVLDGWPARTTRSWADLSYLKAAVGHRTVPVEIGDTYLDDSFEERLMTIGEYIDRYVQPKRSDDVASGCADAADAAADAASSRGAKGGGGGEGCESEVPCTVAAFGKSSSTTTTTTSTTTARPHGYLAQHQLFEQCPRLRRDIATPDYCTLSLEESSGEEAEEEEEEKEQGKRADAPRRRGSRAAATPAATEPRINAWFGPAGTLSPLHFDRSHNLLCQVVGSKYVRLYAPEHSERLYPHTSGPHVVSSRIVDPDAPGVSQAFPRLVEAAYSDLLLAPGECLYIPPGFWHLVESREISFSVSFWWT